MTSEGEQERLPEAQAEAELPIPPVYDRWRQPGKSRAGRPSPTPRAQAEPLAGLAFLGQASRALFSSLDYRATIAEVARLAISGLADHCRIDLVDRTTGVVQCVAAAHDDPAHFALWRELGCPLPGGATEVAIRTGEAAVHAALVPPHGKGVAWAEERALFAFLSPRSLIAVPLAGRDRVIGAIAMVSSEAGRYTQTELELVEELAWRITMTVEYAWLHEAEREARQEAERASRAKSEFLAAMSHELRTPLNALIGYTDLVADGIDGAVNEVQRRHLLRVGLSARHLLVLIDEVLSLSRIDSASRRPRVAARDLLATVRQAVDQIAPQAMAKQLALDVQADGPCALVTDHGQVGQILLNLLSNAVKFTGHGVITVTVRAPAGEAMVRIEVRDTGTGIERAHWEHIFEPFWQAEQAPARRVAGAGLGLSVARQLARQLGGDVTVESVPEQGSCFAVLLPRT